MPFISDVQCGNYQMFVIGMRQNQENVANNHIVPLPMLSRDILMYRNNII
jgi:hypothetical protein